MPGVGTILKRAAGPIGVALDLLDSPEVGAADELDLIKKAKVIDVKATLLSRLGNIKVRNITPALIKKHAASLGIAAEEAAEIANELMGGIKLSTGEGFDAVSTLAKKGAGEIPMKKPAVTVKDVAPLMDDVPGDQSFVKRMMSKIGGMKKRYKILGILGIGLTGKAMHGGYKKKQRRLEEEKLEVLPADKYEYPVKFRKVEDIEAARDSAFQKEDSDVMKAINRLEKLLQE